MKEVKFDIITSVIINTVFFGLCQVTLEISTRKSYRDIDGRNVKECGKNANGLQSSNYAEIYSYKDFCSDHSC